MLQHSTLKAVNTIKDMSRLLPQLIPLATSYSCIAPQTALQVTIHVTIATIPLTLENLYAVCGSVLQCVAVCCSVLQCVIVSGSVLQCVALHPHTHMCCVCMCLRVCACVCVCTRACVCVCVCVYIFFLSYTLRMWQSYIFIFDIHAPIHIYTHPRTHICSSHSFNHPLSFSLSLSHTCALIVNFTPPTHTHKQAETARVETKKALEAIAAAANKKKEEEDEAAAAVPHTHMQTPTHIHAQTHTITHSPPHTNTPTYTRLTRAHTRTYAHAHTRTLTLCLSFSLSHRSR